MLEQTGSTYKDMVLHMDETGLHALLRCLGDAVQNNVVVEISTNGDFSFDFFKIHEKKKIRFKRTPDGYVCKKTDVIVSKTADDFLMEVVKWTEASVTIQRFHSHSTMEFCYERGVISHIKERTPTSEKVIYSFSKRA